MGKLNPLKGQRTPVMAAATDPNIDHLHQLADHYREAEQETARRRNILDKYIQELKRAGYSYPTLAKESGLAQGTIQNIIAKDTP